MGFWKSELSPYKSETFTLSSKSIPISDERKHEIHLSEKANVQDNSDTLQKSKSNYGEDVNQPLCPMLPGVKRNSENKLAMWIKSEEVVLSGPVSSKERVPFKEVKWSLFR